MRDRNPLVYGPSEPMLAALSPQARAERHASDFCGRRCPVDRADRTGRCGGRDAANPMFDVQYGPQAVQWCTRRAAAKRSREASERTGRRMHMHLLETRYQRNLARRQLSAAASCKYLDEIGFLSAAADARPLHLGAAGRDWN